ncbi:MAG: hypothetical protein ACP5GU_04890 [Thermoprotei archaeon]|jgi:hypothetical protein
MGIHGNVTFDKCIPICPHFKCAKKALIIKRPEQLFNGAKYAETQKKMYGQLIGNLVYFCTWANDVCIGYRCNYAICEKRAFTPNGLCGLGQRPVTKFQDIEQIAKHQDREISRATSLLKKKGLKYEE